MNRPSDIQAAQEGGGTARVRSLLDERLPVVCVFLLLLDQLLLLRRVLRFLLVLFRGLMRHALLLLIAGTGGDPALYSQGRCGARMMAGTRRVAS
jgi:hypothetical protein